jgi:hypothetical protein
VTRNVVAELLGRKLHRDVAVAKGHGSPGDGARRRARAAERPRHRAGAGV